MNNIIEKALEESGITRTTVMFKKDFAFDEATEVLTGTLASVEYDCVSVEENRINFILEAEFLELPPVSEKIETLHCVLNLDDNSINIRGLYEDIPLSDLLVAVDENTDAMVDDFWEKKEEYETEKSKWENRTCDCFVATIITGTISFGVNYFCTQYTSFLSDLIYWVSLIPFMLSIPVGVFFRFATYEDSKIGKLLYKQLEDTYTEIIHTSSENG